MATGFISVVRKGCRGLVKTYYLKVSMQNEGVETLPWYKGRFKNRMIHWISRMILSLKRNRCILNKINSQKMSVKGSCKKCFSGC